MSQVPDTSRVCGTFSASLFKKVVVCLKELVEFCNLQFTSDGFHINCMDACNVCLIDFYLQKSDFKNYQCEQDRIIGLNLSNLSKILNFWSDDDLITISHAAGSAKLLCSIYKKDDNVRDLSFRLSIFDVNQERFNIDELKSKLKKFEYPN